ncbi:hypothetical protein COCNU_scaffold038832G000010 [Cocos nucifera]|nr:hypothetical protein [Cocos nucifera]
MKVPKLSQLVMDQSLFDSGISLVSSQVLIRFDPRRLAELKKRKSESLDPLPTKKEKGKDVASATSASHRPVPPCSRALVINAAPVSTLSSPTSSLMSIGHLQIIEVLPTSKGIDHPMEVEFRNCTIAV